MCNHVTESVPHTLCYHVSMVPIWYLTTVCYHVCLVHEMPQSFIIKLYSETQVSGRLGMSGGISPRHAQNPLSGERRKTLSITLHALSPPPSHHHLYIIHLINWLQRFYRIIMSLKRPFVPKSDVKQWFTTTTCLVPDYGVLPRQFGAWLRCVTMLLWYLTTVCYHVSLVLSTESVPHTLCYHVSMVPDPCVTTLVWYLTMIC